MCVLPARLEGSAEDLERERDEAGLRVPPPSLHQGGEAVVRLRFTV